MSGFFFLIAMLTSCRYEHLVDWNSQTCAHCSLARYLSYIYSYRFQIEIIGLYHPLQIFHLCYFCSNIFLHLKYSLPALLSENTNALVYFGLKLPQIYIVLSIVSSCLMERRNLNRSQTTSLSLFPSLHPLSQAAPLLVHHFPENKSKPMLHKTLLVLTLDLISLYLLAQNNLSLSLITFLSLQASFKIPF